MAVNDLTIDWLRRPRILFRVFAPSVTPEPETPEVYEIDMLKGGLPVATKIITDATTFLYTAAAQTTDGLTPGVPIDMEIFHVSALIGRGRVLAKTI